LFTDREILLPCEYEQSLYSGVLEVWRKHASDMGKLMQKDSQRAVKVASFRLLEPFSRVLGCRNSAELSRRTKTIV